MRCARLNQLSPWRGPCCHLHRWCSIFFPCFPSVPELPAAQQVSLGCWLQFLAGLACLSPVHFVQVPCRRKELNPPLLSWGQSFLSHLLNFVPAVLPFFPVRSPEPAPQSGTATALAPYTDCPQGTHEPDRDGILPRGHTRHDFLCSLMNV